MNRVAITGVAGFIGSHLALKHLDQGDEVFGIDNLSTGKLANLEGLSTENHFKFLQGDATLLASQIPDVDVIYHFASPASPKKYMKMALGTLEVNSAGTINLAKKSLACGARLIFASTSEVYGDPLISPQTEEYWGNVNPVGPRSVYDEAKRFGESVVAHFQRESDANLGIIRIFNTYGPKMDPWDGRVVSTFVRQALEGEPLTIFGSGEQTRSFCYIDDLISGIQLMGQSNHKGPVNLGNPREVSLLELAGLVQGLVGSKSPLVFRELPEDDPKRRNPDITKAKSLLSWEPRVSLEAGVARTIQWMRQIL